MNCDPLAITGLSSNILVVVVVAVVCLVGGAIALLLARSPGTKGGRIATALLIVLIGGIVLAIGPGPAAHAASTDCNAPANSLSVTQTSTMDGIAPGVAPRPIAGLVVNEGSDSTHIAAVDVAITAVTTSPDAPAGTCDATDFSLANVRMPVGRTLAPGASTTFSGASIGFASKSINQDACQNAVIHLLYTANPAR